MVSAASICPGVHFIILKVITSTVARELLLEK
jgi:hypothetical protein